MMNIKAIDYEKLEEGNLITWFGVHVLTWERDIRPLGIEPTIAFVQDDTEDELIKQLRGLVEAVNKYKKSRLITDRKAMFELADELKEGSE